MTGTAMLHLTTPDRHLLEPAQADVLQALALGVAPRPRTWILGLLGKLGWRSRTGKAYTNDLVRDAVRELSALALIQEAVHRQGYWTVSPSLKGWAYQQALQRANADRLRAALASVENFDEKRGWSTYFHTPDAACAMTRLELYLGAPPERIQQLERYSNRGWFDWEPVYAEAALDGVNPTLFERIHPQLRGQLLARGIFELSADWKPERHGLVDIAARMLDGQDAVPAILCFALGEYAILSGQPQKLDALLQPLRARNAHPDGGVSEAYSAVLQAARLTTQGRWAEAQAGFEAGLKALRAQTGQRKNLVPASISWLYCLALMAQGGTRQIEGVRKFAASEAGGQRALDMFDGCWSVLWHAARMRLGEVALNLDRFLPLTTLDQDHHTDFWRWLVRAWLGDDRASVSLQKREREAAALVRERMVECGLAWMATQLDGALAVLQGETPPPHFFVPGRQESWRITLSTLAALGQPQNAGASGAAAQQSRLIWSVQLDAGGRVTDITPWEQKHGARGWSKPKDISLSKLAGNERLEPWDARVAPAIQRDAYYKREYRLDLASAIMALIGHPHVEFVDAPDVPVDLIEGVPHIDVAEKDGSLHVRVVPEFQAEPAPAETYATSSAERKEAEALRMITVLRDSPQRARVIRLTAAQQRAAQLVGKTLVLPRSAQAELQPALRGLAAHFEVHADEIEATREVPADARLRAELTPQGEGIALRLVVAPLGHDGPRVTPAHGRARMIAAVRGETLGAQRNLDAERQHLEQVLDACPMLEAPPRQAASLEWVLEAPEHALGLLEMLSTLGAVSGLDWPKGKAMTVQTIDTSGLRVTVSSAHDWFALSGELRVDERAVLTLQQLLDWSREGKGRFVPLGEGQYAALTESLRSRLDALATVADSHKRAAQVPRLAAPWLEHILEGTDLHADEAFRAQIEKLKAAQENLPALPGGLQAQLRPYQEEGYQWAMRLAACGFGACLADDMGLGKTLQALAVLLARAPEGPALVVAPTSLTGNWLAEGQRVAPALNLCIYGEGDGDRRDAMIREASAGDVVVVSYALMLQATETFLSRRWHTLVVDEAQAIKNASAKRSQAVFELEADFRLALSGTPIENRLTELWSILRFCNPGLLGSATRFNERFVVPIERKRNREAQRTLRRLIAPFILRRTKSQVLEELPPRTELQLAVTPDQAEMAHYEALRRQAVVEAEQSLADSNTGAACLNILAQLTRLRRAACDPRLVSPELGLIGAKARAFAALATELAANQHKTLVFSQFVDFLALLREPLDEAGISYQYLDGATPAAERNRRVAAFQAGEGDLFLISLKAGGFGLNLTAADYVVIADPWWNPAAEDQAMGRAHRMGQQRPVTVYRLVNQGTLEERIVALHQNKRALAEGILEGGDSISPPSTDELIALLKA
jgi:superfamily II DNA or RNA helicase